MLRTTAEKAADFLNNNLEKDNIQFQVNSIANHDGTETFSLLSEEKLDDPYRPPFNAIPELIGNQNYRYIEKMRRSMSLGGSMISLSISDARLINALASGKDALLKLESKRQKKIDNKKDITEDPQKLTEKTKQDKICLQLNVMHGNNVWHKARDTIHTSLGDDCLDKDSGLKSIPRQYSTIIKDACTYVESGTIEHVRTKTKYEIPPKLNIHQSKFSSIENSILITAEQAANYVKNTLLGDKFGKKGHYFNPLHEKVEELQKVMDLLDGGQEKILFLQFIYQNICDNSGNLYAEEKGSFHSYTKTQKKDITALKELYTTVVNDNINNQQFVKTLSSSNLKDNHNPYNTNCLINFNIHGASRFFNQATTTGGSIRKTIEEAGKKQVRPSNK